MTKLRFVKLLVFFLSFAIIFGMILAGQLLYKKTSAARGNHGPVSINLNQAKGSYIVDYQTKDNLIVLHLKGGNSGERLLVVDAPNNTLLSTITLN